MAKIFTDWTREEFKKAVDSFNWKRKLNELHFHHTWQPNHAQWQGLKSMQGMYNYHVNTNKWSDIAQHVTIAPDGRIWSGRDWNKSPSSSTNRNGNASVGPFMWETVGNFDKGNDVLEGEQLESVLFVIAYMQNKFKLPLTSLRFHNQLGSPKTCPGTSLVYSDVLKWVEDYSKDVLPRYL